jgi:hypothetical protein
LGVSGESGEVAFDACDDAGVAGDFGVPAAVGGVVAQRGGVGELGVQGGDELGSAYAVSLFAADRTVGRSQVVIWSFKIVVCNARLCFRADVMRCARIEVIP